MSRQRERAAIAYKEVLKIRDHEKKAKLKTLCMKTPALIHQSGAAQAIAFLRSREGDIGRDFCDHLARVMGLKDQTELNNKAFQKQELLKYMVFSEDLADAAAWMRRFAQSDLANVDEEN